MAARKPDVDSPWKEALEHYFSAFIQLLAPTLHEHIDWSQHGHRTRLPAHYAAAFI